MTNANQRRKQFKAAVALAGTTVKEWAESKGVTVSHLNQVLRKRRESPRLDGEIDALIEKYVPQKRKNAA